MPVIAEGISKNKKCECEWVGVGNIDEINAFQFAKNYFQNVEELDLKTWRACLSISHTSQFHN